MKRILQITFFLGCFLGMTQLHAQVGIGTETPSASAQLEIVSNDKGILIPRVALKSEVDQTTISAGNVESLLVWNTETNPDMTPGYYYWYQDKWQRLITNGAADGVLTSDGDNIYYVNKDGDKVQVDISGIIKGNETLTSLVDHGDGTFTYTDEAGNPITFNANTTTYTDHGDGTFTFSNANGETMEINTHADAIAYDDSTTNLGAGTLQEAIEELTKNQEGGSGITLKDNGNGTVTLGSADGDDLGTIDKSKLTDHQDGTYTFDNGDGNPVTFSTNAADLGYDSSKSGLAANNVQEAIDEINTALAQTSDTLVNNHDGTYTHTAVDGTKVTIDANTTNVSVVDGVYTFTDAAGNPITTIDTNADAIAYDDSTTNLGAGNLQEAIEELTKNQEGGSGITLTDNGNGTVTLGSADGDDLGTIDKSKLTDHQDGTYTFDNGDGNPVTFSTNAADLGYDSSKSGLAANNVQEAIDEINTALARTSDTLVNNHDGTYIHTAVDGTKVTIDANTTNVSVVDGVYTFTDAAGNTITTINTNADHIAFDNNNSSLTSDNVQDALDELADALDAGAGVKLEDNNDGTFQLKSEDGDDLGTITKADLEDHNDGSYTFSNGDGNDITFDVLSVDVSFNATDNKYEFKDKDGAVIGEIDMNADHIAFDNNNSSLASDNVQDALDEISYSIDDIINTKGNLITDIENRIDIVNGNDALLHDVKIDVNEGNLRLQKIGGTLQVGQIQNGSKDQILMTNAGGNGVTWGNASVLAKGDLTSQDLDITNGTASILNNVQLEIAADAITSDKIKDGEVKAEDLGADAGDAGKVGVVQSDGTVVYQNLSSDNVDGKDLSVSDGIEFTGGTDGTGKLLAEAGIGIADGGVTTDKLADDAVTSEKIKDGEVKTADLADEAVTNDKVGADAITSDKIKDGEVKAEDLGADAGDAGKVGVVQSDGTVVYQNVSSDNVDGKDLSVSDGIEFTGGTDGTGKLLAEAGIGIADGGVTTAKLAADAVTSEKIKDGEVKTADLADEAVTNDKVGADAITSDKIKDGEVKTDDIADQTVTSDKLGADAGDAGKVGVVQSDGTVVYQNVSSDNVDGKDLSVSDGIEFTGGTDGTGKLLAEAGIGIADGGVTTDKLADDAVTSEKIKDGEVKTADIADEAVTNDKVGADAITSDKIKDGEVKTDDIADQTVTSDKLGADAGDAGKVGVVQSDGTVVYQNVSSDNVDGKDLSVSDGIEFTGGTDGTGKLLAEAGIGIADGGVTTDKLADDAVTSEKIKDGEVKTADLADEAVTNDKVGADAITSDKIKNGEVKAEDLGANGADAGKVATVQSDGTVVYKTPSVDAGAVENANDLTTDGIITINGATTGLTGALLEAAELGIKDGSIGTNQLANNAVTNDKVGADAITSDKIKDGEVKTGDLADGNVTADKLGADAGDAGKVGVVQSDGTIVYQNLSSENVDGKDLSVSGGIEFTGGTDGTGKLLAAAGIGIADGGVTTAKLAADAITSDKIKNGEVKAEDLGADAGDAGKVATVQSDGTVVYKTPSVNANAIGNSQPLSTKDGITIDVAGNTALLQALTIGLEDVPVSVLESGGNDKILTTDASGNPTWEDKSIYDEVETGTGAPTGTGTPGDIYVDESTGDVYTYNSTSNAWESANEVTADNGLTKTDDNIQLGGELEKPTTITANGTNTLAISGLQEGEGTDEIMVVNPSSGVLKKVKAVMPKFFYMPSMIMPTASSQVDDQIIPHITDYVTENGGTYTVNLYQVYKDQFNLTASNSLSSDAANSDLPILDKTDLIYNITYYDDSVFDNMSLDADGVLTYHIKSGAATGAGSYMNIVFEVK